MNIDPQGLVLVIPREKSPSGTVREGPTEPEDLDPDGSGFLPGLPSGADPTEYKGTRWEVSFAITIAADSRVDVRMTGLFGPPKARPAPVLQRRPKPREAHYEQIRDACRKHAGRYAMVKVTAGGLTVVRGRGPMHVLDDRTGFLLHFGPWSA